MLTVASLVRGEILRHVNKVTQNIKFKSCDFFSGPGPGLSWGGVALKCFVLLQVKYS